MSFQQDQPATPPEFYGIPRRKRTRRSIWLSLLFILLTLAAWGGLVYGGYYYARQYLDQSIQAVQETNAINLQMVQERLDSMNRELAAVKEALGSTGTTLSSSETTQKELGTRLEKLDQQLQELERSLNILKEAPNAPR